MLKELEPVGGNGLPRVSPKIRNLQDRLMDSLPTDGAWECLSPAQREAILSLHHNRLFGIQDDDEPSSSGNRSRKALGYGRRTAVGNKHQQLLQQPRSRSFEDKLETSETDDSGARGLGKGGVGSSGLGSSGSPSQNSHEDDSSDPGVQRPVKPGGRFTKASGAKNVDRSKNYPVSTKSSRPITNGFGNVNKMISKQMHNKSASAGGISNITLDCRNVQGEKRRRSRIISLPEDDAVNLLNHEKFQNPTKYYNDNFCPPQFEKENISSDRRAAQQQPVPFDRAALSRRKILNKYETEEYALPSITTTMRGTPSSEEHDSGIHFSHDGLELPSFHEQPKSMSYLINSSSAAAASTAFYSGNFMSNSHHHVGRPDLQDKQGNKRDINILGTMSSYPSINGDPMRPTDYLDSTEEAEEEEIFKTTAATPGLSRRVLADKNKVTVCGKVNNSCEPLKSNLKSGCGDKMNSSLDYRSTMNQDATTRYSSNWNDMILNNQTGARQTVKYDVSREIFMKAPPNPLAKSTGNLVTKVANSNLKNEVNFFRNDLDNWDDKSDKKKYFRSKSLDRKYVDDTSEDESDFEAHRRFERERRYARNAELENLKIRAAESRLRKSNLDNLRATKTAIWEANLMTNQLAMNGRMNLQSPAALRPKAKSSWDLSRSRSADALEEGREGEIGGRLGGGGHARPTRSRWQNIVAGEATSAAGSRVALMGSPLKIRRKEVRDSNNNHKNDISFANFEEKLGSADRKKVEADLFADRDFERHSKTLLQSRRFLDASREDLRRRNNDEVFDSREFMRKQWRRRSCDFELDAQDEPNSFFMEPVSLDRKRWYRRSCDLDLEFEQHYPADHFDRMPDASSKSIPQFQSLPPYHEGLQVPEEIMLGTPSLQRCVGRRGGIRPSGAATSALGPQMHPVDLDPFNGQPPEELGKDAGHEMYLLNKSKSGLVDQERVEGRMKFRFDDIRNNNVSVNPNNLKYKNDDRPKTSIGHYNKNNNREKNNNNKPPHLLKGKLRLFKSILSF